MFRTLTVLAATSFLSVALACGGPKTASGKSGCPMAAAQALASQQQAVQDAAGTKVDLAVQGLTCGGCASQVQAALMGIDGVEAAFVNHEDGKAKIAFDAKKTSLDALIAAVTSAGDYQAAEAAAAVN